MQITGRVWTYRRQYSEIGRHCKNEPLFQTSLLTVANATVIQNEAY